MREYLLMREGYKRKMEVEKIKILEGWKQARMIAYSSAVMAGKVLKQDIDIYDFMPLPSDPSAEEIAEMKNRNEQEMNDTLQLAIEWYRKQGYNV